jgi:hypothetical protein
MNKSADCKCVHVDALYPQRGINASHGRQGGHGHGRDRVYFGSENLFKFRAGIRGFAIGTIAYACTTAPKRRQAWLSGGAKAGRPGRRRRRPGEAVPVLFEFSCSRILCMRKHLTCVYVSLRVQCACLRMQSAGAWAGIKRNLGPGHPVPH